MEGSGPGLLFTFSDTSKSNKMNNLEKLDLKRSELCITVVQCTERRVKNRCFIERSLNKKKTIKIKQFNQEHVYTRLCTSDDVHLLLQLKEKVWFY